MVYSGSVMGVFVYAHFPALNILFPLLQATKFTSVKVQNICELPRNHPRVYPGVWQYCAGVRTR